MYIECVFVAPPAGPPTPATNAYVVLLCASPTNASNAKRILRAQAFFQPPRCLRTSCSICFWNVDYCDALNIYPLRSVNRMECEFISLCNYDIYVSAKLYKQYYNAVKDLITREQRNTDGNPQITGTFK